MKKAISVMSIAAIAATVLFEIFNLIVGFISMNQPAYMPESPSRYLYLAIGFVIACAVFSDVLNILVALYLLFLSEKKPSFVPEIVISVTRFIVLPFIINIVTAFVRVTLLNKLHPYTDTMLYSSFFSGFQNFFSALNPSSLLLIFALALSLALKALAKQESKENARFS